MARLGSEEKRNSPKADTFDELLLTLTNKLNDKGIQKMFSNCFSDHFVSFTRDHMSPARPFKAHL